MAVVNVKIENRIASVDAGIVLVCNNPTDTLLFDFDAEWEGKSPKTARFVWENRYIDVQFEGNSVQVPEIFKTDYVFIGVYSTNIASTPVKVACNKSVLCICEDGKRMTTNDPFYYEFIDRITSAEQAVAAMNQLVNDTYAIAQEGGIQVNVPGNAGTATKLKEARKIGNADFDGSADITVEEIGAADRDHTHSPEDLTDVVPVEKGGTGKNSLTAGNYIVGNGSNALGEKTPADVLSDIGASKKDHVHGEITNDGKIGTSSNQFLTTTENGAITTSAVSEVVELLEVSKTNHTHALTDDAITGILPASKGGIGKDSVTAGNFLVGNGTDAMVEKTPAEVLTAIGAQPALTVTTEDMTAGTSELESGKVVLVYE